MSFVIVDEPAGRPEFLREALRIVAETIERERERLLAHVAAADDAALAAGTEDDWGVGQVAAHLLVVEGGISGIALRLARGEPPGTTGQPRPAVGSADRAQIAALAERSKERLAALLAKFPPQPNATATARHPYFGEMNCYGWVLTVPLHYTAHLEALDRGTRSAL